MKLMLAGLASLTLTGCATNLDHIPGPSSLPSADDSIQSAQMLPNTYRLGPLDEIRLSVFREPDLTLEKIIVGIDGQFSVPLIGEVAAIGKTTKELEDEIAIRLQSRYLKNPQVSVSIVEPNSHYITVDGEVKRPGIQKIPGRITLQQAIAGSAGLTMDAREKDILVFRTINGTRHVARFNLAAIRAAKAEDVELASGDLVVVGLSKGTRVYRDLLTVLPGLAGIFIALSQQ